MERSCAFRGSDVLREEIRMVGMRANIFGKYLQSLLPTTAFGESWKINGILDRLEEIEKTAMGGEGCPDDEVENYYLAILVFQGTIKVELDSIDHPELTGFLW